MSWSANDRQELAMTPNLPEIVSREEWIAARQALLDKEKRFTRERDTLNADRRRLPMVEVDKPYRFHGPRGEARLADLFVGGGQAGVSPLLLLYCPPIGP